MGFFNNQERINRGQAMEATPSQPVQELELAEENRKHESTLCPISEKFDNGRPRTSYCGLH